MRHSVFSLSLAFALAFPASAQEPMTVVAVPQFSTPKNEPTSGENTGVLARRVAERTRPTSRRGFAAALR